MRTLQINEAGSNRGGGCQLFRIQLADVCGLISTVRKGTVPVLRELPSLVGKRSVCVRGALEEQTSKSCGHIEALFSAFS